MPEFGGHPSVCPSGVERAPWLTTAHSTAAGELTPLSFQRLHDALRRRVLQHIFAASAAGADCQHTGDSYEQILRIAACHQTSPGCIAQRRRSISAKV